MSDAGVISCFGGERQSLFHKGSGARRVALGPAAQRKVVERDEDDEPVRRATGLAQALGKKIIRTVGVVLTQRNLA